MSWNFYFIIGFEFPLTGQGSWVGEMADSFIQEYSNAWSCLIWQIRTWVWSEHAFGRSPGRQDLEWMTLHHYLAINSAINFIQFNFNWCFVHNRTITTTLDLLQILKKANNSILNTGLLSVWMSTSYVIVSCIFTPVSPYFNTTNHSFQEWTFVPFHPFPVVMIAARNVKDFSFSILEPFIPMILMNAFVVLTFTYKPFPWVVCIFLPF